MPARVYLPAPKNKYNNVHGWVDGLHFHSQREIARYEQLKQMERAGLIAKLVVDKRELRWDLVVNGIKICRYEADFSYIEKFGALTWGSRIVEDVKGMRTAIYRLKKKLMLACHGIEIREV